METLLTGLFPTVAHSPHPSYSPSARLSQTVIHPTSDIFRLVCERKDATDRLSAMENRIKSLKYAEIKAGKRVEEVKRLRAAKATLREIKVREEEEKRKIREKRRDMEENLRKVINSQRSQLRNSVIQAKQTLFQAKKDTVERLRLARERYKAQLQVRISEEIEWKCDRKESIVSEMKEARERNLSMDLERRERRKAVIQSRRESEMASKAAMEHRIRELEDVEAGLVDQLKHTFQNHENEVKKLETMITSSRLTSSLDFSVPRLSESRCS